MTSSEQVARSTVRPYYPHLFQAIINAWNRYLQLPEEVRYILSRYKSARANAVWSFILHEAQSLFQDHSSIRAIENPQNTIFVIDERVIIRFKKLDSKGFSQNYPTQTALGFNAQLEIPGVPSLLRLDVGYVLNDIGTSISRVLVVCRSGNTVRWLDEIDPPTTATVTPLSSQSAEQLQRQPKIKSLITPAQKKIVEEE